MAQNMIRKKAIVSRDYLFIYFWSANIIFFDCKFLGFVGINGSETNGN